MTKTAEQRRQEQIELNKQQDIEFIKSADKWPMWPYLPVKKYIDRKLTCSFIFAGQKELKLYLLPIYRAQELPVDQWPFKLYENAEALVSDGWEVD
jgi:hypothetical protein